MAWSKNGGWVFAFANDDGYRFHCVQADVVSGNGVRGEPRVVGPEASRAGEVRRPGAWPGVSEIVRRVGFVAGSRSRTFRLMGRS